MAATVRNEISHENAMRKLREAVDRGVIVKPVECERCDKIVVASKLGLVAVFPRGPKQWRKPLWLCYTCHDTRIQKRRKLRGSTGDQMHRGPDYEETKRLLIEEGMTYAAITKLYGLASVGSFQETFRRRAKRRGEQWPIPGLKERHDLQPGESRDARHRAPKTAYAPAIPCTGLAADINALLARTKMTTLEFCTEAKCSRYYLTEILSGARRRILFKKYAALDGALERFTVAYEGFEEHSADVRRRLLVTLYAKPRGGLAGCAEAVHVNWIRVRKFLMGYTVPLDLLERIEDVVAKWEAEDGRVG